VSTAETQSGKGLFSLGLWASGHAAGQAHWLAGQPLIHPKMVNFVMLNQKPTRQVHLQETYMPQIKQSKKVILIETIESQ